MIAFLFICMMPAALFFAALPVVLFGLMLETCPHRSSQSTAGGHLLSGSHAASASIGTLHEAPL
jgi:hypothetical protein